MTGTKGENKWTTRFPLTSLYYIVNKFNFNVLDAYKNDFFVLILRVSVYSVPIRETWDITSTS